MGGKIIRGILTGVCILLFVLCIGMISLSVLFGSESVVGLFGRNLYISETDEFENVPLGSAVIVESCAADEIQPGYLVLYRTTGENPVPRMGYTESVNAIDGVYSLTVSDSAGEHIVSEGSLVGVAAWSSEFLGGFITFMMSPLGICLIAVLPCVALIIFEFIRSAASKLPPPEVVPQVKNNPEEEQPSKLSVKPDGSGAYLPRGESKPASAADSVLFRYKTSTERIQPQRRSNDVPVHLTDTAQKPVETPAAKPEAPAGVPMSVAAKRYVDSTLKPAQSAGSKTAELPAVGQKKQSDAFFTQSSAPQIGGRRPAERSTRSVVELEDTLASARRNGQHTASAESRDWRRNITGSTLITDDEDDSADKSRYEVDSILAGLDRKRKP
ncbi:MAG: hypothetical protein ACI4KM_07900 [Oscillospiraceae bacterium]